MAPRVCPFGTFRSKADSVACRLCPQGMISLRNSVSDQSLCEPCPAGVVCAVDGMTSISTQSTPCPEGFVCKRGTSASTQFDQKCPAGFFCGFGTAPETQFVNACESGFGCPTGTGQTEKTRFPCQQGEHDALCRTVAGLHLTPPLIPLVCRVLLPPG